jgi:hypothetical protein
MGKCQTFFIQFSSAGSHIEHLWSSSYTRGGTLFLLLNGKSTMRGGGRQTASSQIRDGHIEISMEICFELSPQRVYIEVKPPIIFNMFNISLKCDLTP